MSAQVDLSGEDVVSVSDTESSELLPDDDLFGLLPIARVHTQWQPIRLPGGAVRAWRILLRREDGSQIKWVFQHWWGLAQRFMKPIRRRLQIRRCRWADVGLC